jgi:hypothetical protein
MHKPLLRAFSLVLLPCLLADPNLVWGAFQATPIQVPPMTSAQDKFQQQALNEPVVRVLKSILPKPTGSIEEHQLLKAEFGRVPLMRKKSPAAVKFLSTIMRTYAIQNENRINLLRDMRFDLYRILRHDVPASEQIMKPFIKPIWTAVFQVLEDMRDGSIMFSPERLSILVLNTIERSRDILTEITDLKNAELQKHRYVLDTSYLLAILSGRVKRWDVAKVFRRAIDADRDILVSALDHLIEATIEGIRLEMKELYKTGKPIPSLLNSAQFNSVLIHTEREHGKYDESALRTGGVPLMVPGNGNGQSRQWKFGASVRHKRLGVGTIRTKDMPFLLGHVRGKIKVRFIGKGDILVWADDLEPVLTLSDLSVQTGVDPQVIQNALIDEELEPLEKLRPSEPDVFSWQQVIEVKDLFLSANPKKLPQKTKARTTIKPIQSADSDTGHDPKLIRAKPGLQQRDKLPSKKPSKDGIAKRHGYEGWLTISAAAEQIQVNRHTLMAWVRKSAELNKPVEPGIAEKPINLTVIHEGGREYILINPAILPELEQAIHPLTENATWPSMSSVATQFRTDPKTIEAGMTDAERRLYIVQVPDGQRLIARMSPAYLYVMKSRFPERSKFGTIREALIESGVSPESSSMKRFTGMIRGAIRRGDPSLTPYAPSGKLGFRIIFRLVNGKFDKKLIRELRERFSETNFQPVSETVAEKDISIDIAARHGRPGWLSVASAASLLGKSNERFMAYIQSMESQRPEDIVRVREGRREYVLLSPNLMADLKRQVPDPENYGTPGEVLQAAGVYTHNNAKTLLEMIEHGDPTFKPDFEATDLNPRPVFRKENGMFRPELLKAVKRQFRSKDKLKGYVSLNEAGRRTGIPSVTLARAIWAYLNDEINRTSVQKVADRWDIPTTTLDGSGNKHGHKGAYTVRLMPSLIRPAGSKLYFYFSEDQVDALPSLFAEKHWQRVPIKNILPLLIAAILLPSLAIGSPTTGIALDTACVMGVVITIATVQYIWIAAHHQSHRTWTLHKLAQAA